MTSSSCAAVRLLVDEIRLLLRKISSLCMRTSSSFTYSVTYYTFIERRSTMDLRSGIASSSVGKAVSATAAKRGAVGFSSYSILEGARATGMRTASSQLMLMSKMLLEVLETLLMTDLASSSFFGLNMFTKDRSRESVGCYSSIFGQGCLSRMLTFFIDVSTLDLEDSVLTKFSMRGSGFLVISSLSRRERVTDLVQAVSMNFSLSELLLPMDCLGVSACLIDTLDLTDFSSLCSICFLISCSFLSSSSYLRLSSSSFRFNNYKRSRSWASACSFF